MDVTFKLREGVLWATATGSVSLVESLKTFRQACDDALGEGSTRVLVDYSAVRGELYPVERYELGRASVDYFLGRSPDFKVAIVGRPPVIDGFVSLIAVNRGLTSAIFHEIEPAVEWLCLFDLPPFPAAPKAKTVSIQADLFSPKAIQLRDTMDDARDQMRKVRQDYQDAIHLIQDTGPSSPDGNLAFQRAAREYDQAVEHYQKAIRAWFSHISNSPPIPYDPSKERSGVFSMSELALSTATPKTERRSRVRYPLVLAISYEVKRNGPIGTGRTLNFSSKGIIFTTDQMLPKGREIKLAITWPFQLEQTRLQLVVLGRIVRSDLGVTAVNIERYEFHTRRTPTD